MLSVAYDFSLDNLEHFVLLKLVLDKTVRKLRGIDRNIYLLHNIGNSSDVILMSVRDKESFYLIVIVLQVSQIRHDEIYSKHIVLRKRQSTVDHNNAVVILESGNVHTDLLKSAQRNDPQLFSFLILQNLPPLIL